MRFAGFIILLCLTLCGCSESGSPAEDQTEESLTWNEFDSVIFEKASASNKLVLLDIGANWCHWCHVMDDSTYSNDEVISFLNENFVLSRADQDERPDLYATYRAYGWPATIVFNAEGEELLKLRGYQHRKKFIRQLQAVLDEPVPLVQKELKKLPFTSSDIDSAYNYFMNNLNHEQGGYVESKMQLHREGFELGIKYAEKDERLKAWTKKTFHESLNLLDPTWSGVYQYSDKSIWTSPHYEKLLKNQATYISAYCRFAVAFNSSIAQNKAMDIYSYCVLHLKSDDGWMNKNPLFFNSQDADVSSDLNGKEFYGMNNAERLEHPEPKRDEHTFTKENAMMASAMVHLWAATGDQAYLVRGQNFLDEFENYYQNLDDLYIREIGKLDIVSFDDNLALLEALVVMQQATGSKEYQRRATLLASNMYTKFRNENGLMLSAIGDLVVPAKPVAKSNLSFAILLNRLGHIAEREDFIEGAKIIFENVDRKRLSTKLWSIPYLLKANDELNREPYHAVLLVDGTGTAVEKSLVRRILLNKDDYFVIEILDLNELEGDDEMFYGGNDSGTLFMCTDSYCSPPIYDKRGLEAFLQEL